MTLSGVEGNERVTQKTVTLRLWLDSRSGGHVIRCRCVWTIIGFCVAAKLYALSSSRAVRLEEVGAGLRMVKWRGCAPSASDVALLTTRVVHEISIYFSCSSESSDILINLR